MIFSGTSGFSLQKRLADQLTQKRRGMADTMGVLAKMRFNINIEKAKRNEMEKKIEEEELRAAKKRRQDAEDLLRKTNLCNARDKNLEMHADIKVKASFARQEFLKEKDNIQTSLKSKELDE